MLVALLSSNAKQPPESELRFAFRKLQQNDLPYREVSAQLRKQLLDDGSSTSLAPDSSFWLYAEIKGPRSKDLALEIRHLRLVQGTFTDLRDGDEAPRELSWHHAKGGVVLNLPANSEGQYHFIAKVTPRYSTVLKFFIWPHSEYEKSVEAFNRMGGALAGACTVLALTMGLLGLRNRDLVAILFGITVLLMLRIAAFNSGWDMQWLGIEVPTSMTMTLLRASLPLYAITQTALFITLFKRELKQLKLFKITSAFCATFALLFFISPIVEHETFLRIWWGMSAPGAAWLIFVMARVVTKTPDRAAQLYALALVVTMAGALAEIAYLMGLWTTHVSSSLLGVLLGSALNAAAVAERLYTDRAKAEEAQRREINALKEKEDVFQSSPTPLFEFDASGYLKHCNLSFGNFARSRGFIAVSPASALRWDSLFGEQLPFSSLSDSGSLESLRLNAEQSSAAQQNETYVDLRWTRDGADIRGSVQDVTERELARQAMQRLIDYDQLTGVLNVHGLLRRVRELGESGRTLDRYSLALVDISRFESINELFGHEAGDVVLKSFARRLAGHCRGDEAVGRIGADTFAVLFPNASIEDAGRRIRDIASQATDHPVAVGGKAIAIAVCVGVVSPSGDMSLEQAIGASLRATQRAKRSRSGAVSVAIETTERLGEYLNEKRLLGRIADRLPTENFFQVMQPIINLRHPRRQFSAEALIRMRSDTGDTIPPGQFIAAAERNGMMQEIDRWTLRTACEWLNVHRDRLDALEYLTVNVSGVSLNDIQFHADVRAILADFPVESRKLCFEVTESIAVSDIETTTRFTEQLRSLGARVALDDFGAGYTSFGYLRTIPAEILKIDGEIIKSVAKDPASTAILRAIRDIASDLGMRCVAEFVANFDTLRALRELDVDYGQGFVLSRPVLPERLVGATCCADLIADADVVRYLDAQAGRGLTTATLRVSN